MRHFTKIAEGIDVVPILNALAVRPDLWNENDLRTTFPGSPHAATDDVWCLFNDPTNPDAVVNDLDVVPFRAWEAIPGLRGLILDLMRRVDGHRLGRVLITRLAPGQTIPEHVDEGAPATYFSRYHVALQSCPGALNISGGETITYRMGEMWWFDNRAPHSVVNNSADDRIVIVMDVRC
jgi:glycerol-3-phosphate dehydrogenase